MGVFVFLFLLEASAGANDTLWQYYKAELHHTLEQRDFYGAKQQLARLQRIDPQAYRDKGFASTAAWIAFQEGNWDSAYRHNRQAARWNAATALEMAICLQKMGRYEEAIAHTRLPGIRFRGSNLWEVYNLRAQCLYELGRHEQAVTYFEKLTSSKAPGYYRISAYQALIGLYYDNGNYRRARSIAERIQNNSPGSDAALASVVIQEEREADIYLDRVATWKRFARVCYNNRDYDRSDRYFGYLEDEAKGVDAQRAAYFRALTNLKKGRSDEARKAFQQVADKLSGGRFEGPAAFQYARSLFMSGLDHETIDFVEQYWREGNDAKWRSECMRLSILAMRRLGDDEGFRRLGRLYERQGAPGWLKWFYHRNGVVWELGNQRPQQAMAHLEKYRRSRMKHHERQEIALWEGLIKWEEGRYEEAVEQWLYVVRRDPNHYFGLVARQFIQEADTYTNLWEKEWALVQGHLENQPSATLRRLYFLAPDQSFRERIAAHLKKDLPDAQWLHRPPDPRFGDEVLNLADIGRYDRAARQLTRKGNKLEYHYLEAVWYMKAGMLHDSIRHAEILVNSWPRWAPYELLPPEVQALAFPDGFGGLVHEKAETYQVDPYLLLAIIREESRFNTRAKSWASARGLMQFIPSTAQETASQVEGLEDFDLPMLYEADTAITLGAKYVDNLMETFDGVSLYTVAAYNAGEGAVKRWSSMTDDEDPLRFVWDVTYDETRYYCQKVLRAYHHYNRVYNDQGGSVIVAPNLEDSRGLRQDRLALPR